VNAFGVEVAELNVPRFVEACHVAYVLGALVSLWFVFRSRRPTVIVGVVALANAAAWFITTWPLQRLYALGVGRDRLLNLAMSQVVATGHSPLETWQVGQSHLAASGRPHNVPWVALTALASGFDPDRMLALYVWLPLVAVLLCVAGVYWGLGVRGPTSWSPWERALASGFATLLLSGPLDHAWRFGNPWALMFMLKPNHAIGLAASPIVLRAFARANTTRGRLLAAGALHLLAWLFALHMALVAAGLLAAVALGGWSRTQGWRDDGRAVAVGVGANALVVSPYVLLLWRRGTLAGLSSVPSGGAPAALLLWGVFGTGLLWGAAIWGLAVAWRRGDRLGRLLVGQVVAAILVAGGRSLMWALDLQVTGALAEVFQQTDELFIWLRFVIALAAAVGSWDLASRAAKAWRPGMSDASRAAAVLLVCLPWSLPYWWDPPRMDRYFALSREPLPRHLVKLGRFLRSETPPDAVLAGDAYLARWAAALAGRRSVSSMGLPQPADLERRGNVIRALLAGGPAKGVADAAHYGVSHLLLTQELLENYDLTWEGFDRRAGLRRVYWDEEAPGGPVAVYALEERPAAAVASAAWNLGRTRSAACSSSATCRPRVPRSFRSGSSAVMRRIASARSGILLRVTTRPQPWSLASCTWVTSGGP
jgi:hypothetical protein